MTRASWPRHCLQGGAAVVRRLPRLPHPCPPQSFTAVGAAALWARCARHVPQLARQTSKRVHVRVYRVDHNQERLLRNPVRWIIGHEVRSHSVYALLIELDFVSTWEHRLPSASKTSHPNPSSSWTTQRNMLDCQSKIWAPWRGMVLPGSRTIETLFI